MPQLSLSVVKKRMIGHIRRSGAFLLNFIFNHRPVFCAIGWINRHLSFLSSVFLVYPASSKYALSYVYVRHLHLSQWSPWLLGIFRQNNKWGVMLGISSTEKDFYQKNNTEKLRQLVNEIEVVRHCLGASQKTFSGILPGVLYAKGIVQETLEADITVEVIIEAEQQVRELEGIDENVPLVILGGQGFIGRRLISKFNGREIYCIDVIGRTDKAEHWPNHIRGQKAVLLNVSRQTVLSQYLPRLWPEMVLLNEVYPEPNKRCLRKISMIGLSVYHIVGVEGQAYPPFPQAYAGGIPACAARLTPEMQVLVRKLV